MEVTFTWDRPLPDGDGESEGGFWADGTLIWNHADPEGTGGTAQWEADRSLATIRRLPPDEVAALIVDRLGAIDGGLCSSPSFYSADAVDGRGTRLAAHVAANEPVGALNWLERELVRLGAC